MNSLHRLIKFFHKVQNSRAFQTGAPFAVFLLVASFGLKEFTQVRYDIKKRHGRSLEMEQALERRKIERKPPQSMEEIYDETMKKMDIDDWFNLRGPRKGENSKAMQDLQRKEHRKLLEKNTSSK